MTHRDEHNEAPELVEALLWVLVVLGIPVTLALWAIWRLAVK